MCCGWSKLITTSFLVSIPFEEAFSSSTEINGADVFHRLMVCRGSAGDAWYTVWELERCHEAQHMMDVRSVQTRCSSLQMMEGTFDVFGVTVNSAA